VQTNALAFLMVLALALWVSSASALDRTGAIDAAKRQVKDRCTTEAPCTFDAKAQEGNWHVRVQFTKRRHAIFIINQSGKVIGRMEGE
jgi:hypothetical protein